MPRCPNTKPTSIYWLTDVRIETMAEGWPQGKPFYCGKTVATPHSRFRDHKSRAIRYPKRKISKILTTCGRDNVRIIVMTSVAAGSDWAATEQQWIAQLRLINPDCANVGRGGEGPAGMVHSAETRAKLKLVHANRSPEWNKRISIGRTGIGHTQETRKKMSISQRASKLAAENLRRMSEGNRGRKASAESNTKRGASLKEFNKLHPTRCKRGPYKPFESLSRSAQYRWRAEERAVKEQSI